MNVKEKNMYDRKWRKNNPEKVRECNKNYRKDNLAKVKELNRVWQQNNPDKVNGYGKLWRDNNPDKVKDLSLKYYKNNSDRVKEYHKNWVKNNLERTREITNKALKKYNLKNKDNIKNKLRLRLSCAIATSLNGNKHRKNWETIVGYTIQKLIEHLENQFIDGMAWDNYGKYGWHIDHIIPISWWHYNSYDDREFKQCWALCNLQPLWAKDNLIKGNRGIK
jgi:hypothetical protein